MFIDSVICKFVAGSGGSGVIAWRREKYLPKGGPCGGNGGRGASIYLVGSSEAFSLDSFRNRRIIKAESGKPGGSNNKQGKSGSDLIITLPLGTLVKDSKTGEILFDIEKEGEKILLCEGGSGGIGNTFFKTPTNQAPKKCTPGKPGEIKEFQLELKLIADVGFIGMPSAGKSTLFSTLSNVPVKQAAYHFTTLYPNLSFVEFDDYSRVYIADIPGIIKNAHKNKGLGLEFLRHIERTSLLVYIIDISGIDGRDPYDDFLTLQEELSSYSKDVAKKPFFVVLNKMDTEDSAKNLQEFKKKFTQDKDLLFPLSALTGDDVSPFIFKLKKAAQINGMRFR